MAASVRHEWAPRMHLCRREDVRRGRRPLQSLHDSSPQRLHLALQLLRLKDHKAMIPLRAHEAEFQPVRAFASRLRLFLAAPAPAWRHRSVKKAASLGFTIPATLSLPEELQKKSRASRVHLSHQLRPDRSRACDELFKRFLCGVLRWNKENTAYASVFPIWLHNKQSLADIFKLDINGKRSPQYCLTQQKEMRACSFNYTFTPAN